MMITDALWKDWYKAHGHGIYQEEESTIVAFVEDDIEDITHLLLHLLQEIIGKVFSIDLNLLRLPW